MTTPAYGSPRDWAAGPDLVYRALAEAAVKQLPPAPGSWAVDAGAGTAAFARQLRRRYVNVVELDISETMLRHDRAERPMAVVGDVTALPLCDGCADLTVAGFVLSHLDDAGRGLSELVRVTKPGGTVLATAFPAGSGAPSHPVKWPWMTYSAVRLSGTGLVPRPQIRRGGAGRQPYCAGGARCRRRARRRHHRSARGRHQPPRRRRAGRLAPRHGPGRSLAP